MKRVKSVSLGGFANRVVQDVFKGQSLTTRLSFFSPVSLLPSCSSLRRPTLQPNDGALSRQHRRQFATLNELAQQRNKPSPSDLYEPRFETTKTYPEFPLINLRFRSYDYVQLEKFQSFAHKSARKYGLEVSESWATAAKTFRAVVYKPRSSQIDSEVELAVYERTVQLKDVPSISLPRLLDFLSVHLPRGMEMTAKEHAKDDERARYVPDLLLIEKQKELKMLDDPEFRKKLGWE